MNIYTNRKQGFTLIELLVVIAIIGILSSIVIGSLGSARQKAKESALKAQLRQALTAVESHYNDKNMYIGQGNPGGSPATWCGDQSITKADDISTGAQSTTCFSRAVYPSNIFSSSEFLGMLRSLQSMSLRPTSDTTPIIKIGGTNTSIAIMAEIPGRGSVYCVDNSGNSRKLSSFTVITIWAVTDSISGVCPN